MFVRLARDILRNMDEMDEERAREYIVEEANEHRGLRFCCSMIWGLAWGLFGLLAAVYIINHF